MKPFSRADRVGELIRRVLTDLLVLKIKDPCLEGVTISGVKMNRDLKLAKVYFTFHKDRHRIEEIQSAFDRAKGFIKRETARELKLRYMPEILFFYDESFDYGEKIEKLLKSVNADNESYHPSIKED